MGARKLNERVGKEVVATRRAPKVGIKNYSTIALKMFQNILAFLQITLFIVFSTLLEFV